jgi:hypothetical protein
MFGGGGLCHNAFVVGLVLTTTTIVMRPEKLLEVFQHALWGQCSHAYRAYF